MIGYSDWHEGAMRRGERGEKEELHEECGRYYFPKWREGRRHHREMAGCSLKLRDPKPSPSA